MQLCMLCKSSAHLQLVARQPVRHRDWSYVKLFTRAARQPEHFHPVVRQQQDNPNGKTEENTPPRTGEK